MKACILIPFFDHGDAIRDVLDAVDSHRDRLPGILVDDGSAPEHARALAEAAAHHPWLQVERRPQNGGKGAALKTGYRAAVKRGFSHALQLDADGQHDPRALPALLEVARRHPEALVLAVVVGVLSALLVLASVSPVRANRGVRQIPINIFF